MLERLARITAAFTVVDDKGKRYTVLKLTEFYKLAGEILDTGDFEPPSFYELDDGERLIKISETEFRRLDSDIILRQV
jgi:hypothetical protein